MTYKNIFTKDTYVVILGDMIDRYRDGQYQNNYEIHDEEYKILKLLTILDIQARKKGGKVIKCFGNHEVMNLDCNFDYVHKKHMKKDYLEYKSNYNRKIIKSSDSAITDLKLVLSYLKKL